MQAHPVPQNILDIEFKLFGAFSLSQFMRILVGCVIGLLFFLIVPIGFLKLGLAGFSILLGIATAIVPNLGIWIVGILKALFISPRYVWKKQARTPEILMGIPNSGSNSSTSINKDIEKQKMKKNVINEISLNQILHGDESNQNFIEDPLSRINVEDDKYLEKEYRNLYAKKDFEIDLNKVNLPTEFDSEERPTSLVNMQMKRKFTSNLIEENSKTTVPPITINSEPKAKIEAFTKKVEVEKSKEYFLEQIQSLKKQLSQLVKDDEYKDKETAILEKINDVYQEMKFVLKDAQTSTNLIQNVNNSTTAGNVTDSKGTPADNVGLHIFGILVNKANQPVSDAIIKFTDVNNKDKVFMSKSYADGRFQTSVKLNFGVYDVTIEHSVVKFHTYRIEIKNQNSTSAFKFREK